MPKLMHAFIDYIYNDQDTRDRTIRLHKKKLRFVPRLFYLCWGLGFIFVFVILLVKRLFLE